jgi:hypothetical protein
VCSSPATQSTWKLLKATPHTPVEDFQVLEQTSSPSSVLAAAYISSMFSGYPDLCHQFPWSAELQRIGLCGASTFVINPELSKLFYGMTMHVLRGLGCKDLRMPAKLEMLIFLSLGVLKSERRILPRRTPIRQTSRIQQSGPSRGLKGTSAHPRVGKMRTEKMGWMGRMTTKMFEGGE